MSIKLMNETEIALWCAAVAHPNATFRDADLAVQWLRERLPAPEEKAEPQPVQAAQPTPEPAKAPQPAKPEAGIDFLRLSEVGYYVYLADSGTYRAANYFWSQKEHEFEKTGFKSCAEAWKACEHNYLAHIEVDPDFFK